MILSNKRLELKRPLGVWYPNRINWALVYCLYSRSEERNDACGIVEFRKRRR